MHNTHGVWDVYQFVHSHPIWIFFTFGNLCEKWHPCVQIVDTFVPCMCRGGPMSHRLMIITFYLLFSYISANHCETSETYIPHFGYELFVCLLSCSFSSSSCPVQTHLLIWTSVTLTALWTRSVRDIHTVQTYHSALSCAVTVGARFLFLLSGL